MLEPLEQRQLLAGDVDLFGPPSSGADQPSGEAAEFSATQTVAEGEPAPDLVAFAKSLTDAGVRYFGAVWCPFCTEQEALFEDGGRFLPFINVSNPDRTLNEVGQAEEIESFPTWEFPDGSRETGVLSLDEISARSGVEIPTSESPSFAEVGDQAVAIGSPLHLPIDSYDPNGQPLTVTVESSDPALLEASVLQGNRSLRMSVQGWGDMVFELFEDRAPRPAERIIELAESGFYDASEDGEIIFHRVIDDFVLQAGDPSGTGAGGSSLGDFDDQFHPDLQHNRTGILSYAKSADDTNDSQFFITEGPQRHLDFNHSIFGQLIEGEKVREGISETETDSSDRPTTPVVIDSFEVFNDTENATLMLKPTGAGTGTVDVTITVTDPDGNTSTEVITVTVVEDTIDSPPFLEDIDSPVTTNAGQPAEIQLSSVDVEGDDVTYVARKVGSVDYTTEVDNATGTVTVTPPDGFVGSFEVEVAVRQSTEAFPANAEDVQRVTVMVGPGAPASIDLDASTDSGVSDEDNITRSTPLTFTVGGVVDGALVRVMADGEVIGEATAEGTTATITTNNLAALGDGTFEITATQRVEGETSDASEPLEVTLDTAAPAQLSTEPPAQASVDSTYRADLAHPEEGAGLAYSLISGPNGMEISATTGQITWMPTSGQVGDQSFVVGLTDAAGNEREQEFTVNVGDEPLVVVRLEAVDSDGNVVTSLAAGETFRVRVFVDDQRPQNALGTEDRGVFAAYLDLLYDSRLLEPAGESPITHGPDYTASRLGSTSTAGIINELGAAAGSTTPLGGEERLLATVTMRALRPGQAVVSGDPADSEGTELLLYDEDDEIPHDRITFGTLSVAIEASFSAEDDDFNVDEDAEDFVMDVLENDNAESGTTLTIVDVGESAAGAEISITDGGTRLSYTPPADYSGGDEFTYTVRDQNGAEQTATVNVQVQPENDPPTAVDDTFDVDEDSTNNFLDVLDNDSSDPDENETLRVVEVEEETEAGGTVEIGSSGTHIRYTPPEGFTGTDTFTYTISDRLNGGLTASATVTINVTPSVPPPTAENDEFTLEEDADEEFYDLISNDEPSEEGETITITAVSTGSAGGSISVSEDGTGVHYQPAANFFGTEEAVYTLTDSGGGQATGTVTFTVTAVNDPPLAEDDEIRVANSASSTTLDVLDNDSGGVDGEEELTIVDVSTPSAGGEVSISNDGKSLVYTPPSDDFTGEDTFTYTIRDPGGVTATADVTVDVVDFVPRTFGGEIQLNGGWRALSLNGAVRLVGTDSFGDAVEVTGEFDADGRVRFPEQAPGNYRLVLDALPFLGGGDEPQEFAIESDEDDGDDVDHQFEVGALRPEFVSIRDFASYSSDKSVLVAVRPGHDYTWISEADDLGVSSPRIAMSSDGREVTIRATDDDGDEVTATLEVGNGDSLVQLRGTSGEYRLLRVTVDPEVVEYEAVEDEEEAGDGGEGEGEAAPTGEGEAGSAATFAASTTTTTGTGALDTLSETASRETTASSTPGTTSRRSSTGANATATGSTETGLTAEGEADARFDAPASGSELVLPLPGQGDVWSTARESSRESAPRGAEPETLSRERLVDSAMDDVLPGLELRSAGGEWLAADDAEGADERSVDALFGALDEQPLDASL